MITAQDKIKALKLARTRLANGKTRYICYALPKNAAGNHLRSFVESQIVPWGTLTSWVASVSTDWPEGERQTTAVFHHNNEDPNLEIDARIRFVNAMIRAIENGTEVQGDWA